MKLTKLVYTTLILGIGSLFLTSIMNAGELNVGDKAPAFAAKDQDGKAMLQKTFVTQKNADERLLVLMVPGEKKDEFTKCMKIRFVKRK